MSEAINNVTDEQEKEDFNKSEWRIKRKWQKVLALIILQIVFIDVFCLILGIVKHIVF